MKPLGQQSLALGGGMNWNERHHNDDFDPAVWRAYTQNKIALDVSNIRARMTFLKLSLFADFADYHPRSGLPLTLGLDWYQRTFLGSQKGGPVEFPDQHQPSRSEALAQLKKSIERELQHELEIDLKQTSWILGCWRPEPDVERWIECARIGQLRQRYMNLPLYCPKFPSSLSEHQLDRMQHELSRRASNHWVRWFRRTMKYPTLEQ